jgi:hypothetical protein
MKLAVAAFFISILAMCGSGCAKKEKNTPVGSQAPVTTPTPATSLAPPSPLEDQSLVRSYLYLRDGFGPETDPNKKYVALEKFVKSAQRAQEMNSTLEKYAAESCRKFAVAFDGVLDQQQRFYKQYLEDTEDDDMIKARLIILRFLSSALIAQTLDDREAGYSELDRDDKSTCIVPDRTAWKNAMAQSYQDMNLAHLAIVGESPAGSRTPQFSGLQESLETTRVNRQWSLWAAETFASFLSWGKFIAPRLPKVGLLSRLALQGGYFLGWYEIDNFLSRDVFKLRVPPLNQEMLFSNWEHSMEAIQDFLNSPVGSPALYQRYLELIGFMRKEQVLVFLNLYHNEMADLEGAYGPLEKRDL